MKKEYKNKEIHLRLTEKEYQSLKEKAKSYPTLSSFVLDACMNFDDELGLKRLHVIRRWSDEFNKYENHLVKIGSNINQIAHYLNKLSSSGVMNDGFIPELKQQYGILIQLLTELNSSNLNFQNNAVDFFTDK